MKDTSVMYFIGVIDLMGRAGNIINANYGQENLKPTAPSPSSTGCSSSSWKWYSMRHSA